MFSCESGFFHGAQRLFAGIILSGPAPRGLCGKCFTRGRIPVHHPGNGFEEIEIRDERELDVTGDIIDDLSVDDTVNVDLADFEPKILRCAVT